MYNDLLPLEVDLRVESDLVSLHMNHATSLSLGHPYGVVSRPHLGGSKFSFSFRFDCSYIEIPRIHVEPFVDKNMSMSWYFSTVSKTVDGVLMWIFMVYPPSTLVGHNLRASKRELAPFRITQALGLDALPSWSA